MDCSPPGSSLHGILQARVLEWVAFPSPGDLPDPGIEPGSPASKADALTSEPPGWLHEVIHKSVYTFLQKDPEFSLDLEGISNVIK